MANSNFLDQRGLEHFYSQLKNELDSKGAGDMLASDYDSDNSVKSAGGIKAYVEAHSGGSSGGMEAFIVTFTEDNSSGTRKYVADHTFAEITSAINAGKAVSAKFYDPAIQDPTTLGASMTVHNSSKIGFQSISYNAVSTAKVYVFEISSSDVVTNYSYNVFPGEGNLFMINIFESTGTNGAKTYSMDKTWTEVLRAYNRKMMLVASLNNKLYSFKSVINNTSGNTEGLYFMNVTADTYYITSYEIYVGSDNINMGRYRASVEDMSPLKVTLTSSVSENNTVWSADKTYDEILDAYDSGRFCYAVITGSGGEAIYPLNGVTSADSESGSLANVNFGVAYTSYYGSHHYIHSESVSINSSNKIKAVDSRYEIPSASTTAPLAPGTAAVGTSDYYAREDHVHPSETFRVTFTSTTGTDGTETYSCDKTIDEITAANQAGKLCYGTYGVDEVYICTLANNGMRFVCVLNDGADIKIHMFYMYFNHTSTGDFVDAIVYMEYTIGETDTHIVPLIDTKDANGDPCLKLSASVYQIQEWFANGVTVIIRWQDALLPVIYVSTPVAPSSMEGEIAVQSSSDLTLRASGISTSGNYLMLEITGSGTLIPYSDAILDTIPAACIVGFRSTDGVWSSAGWTLSEITAAKQYNRPILGSYSETDSNGNTTIYGCTLVELSSTQAIFEHVAFENAGQKLVSEIFTITNTGDGDDTVTHETYVFEESPNIYVTTITITEDYTNATADSPDPETTIESSAIPEQIYAQANLGKVVMALVTYHTIQGNGSTSDTFWGIYELETYLERRCTFTRQSVYAPSKLNQIHYTGNAGTISISSITLGYNLMGDDDNERYDTHSVKSIAIPLTYSTEITLSATKWDSSAKTQTVTVTGVKADETAQLITPVPALASQAAYNEAGILCTAQAENSLTFTAETIPATNLTVYVVVQTILINN